MISTNDKDRLDSLLKLILFDADTNNNYDFNGDNTGGGGAFGEEARPDVLPRLLAFHQTLVRR